MGFIPECSYQSSERQWIKVPKLLSNRTLHLYVHYCNNLCLFDRLLMTLIETSENKIKFIGKLAPSTDVTSTTSLKVSNNYLTHLRKENYLADFALKRQNTLAFDRFLPYSTPHFEIIPT